MLVFSEVGKPGSLFRAAFTLVEILVVLFLMSLVAYPFAQMFLFGWQGSNENAEQIVAYNLAREKIEEVRAIPFELVKSDFENFRDVFRDRIDFESAFESKEGFEKVFSDLLTQDLITQDEKAKTTFERLKDLYANAFRREFELYPDEVKGFRRVMDVDDKFDSSMPPKLKKIIVKVFDSKSHKLAEVVTLVGLHK